MDEEVFSIGECIGCRGEGRVLLGSKCRTCLTNGISEHIYPDTLATINRAYATASDRLLRLLGVLS